MSHDLEVSRGLQLRVCVEIQPLRVEKVLFHRSERVRRASGIQRVRVTHEIVGGLVA